MGAMILAPFYLLINAAFFYCLLRQVSAFLSAPWMQAATFLLGAAYLLGVVSPIAAYLARKTALRRIFRCIEGYWFGFLLYAMLSWPIWIAVCGLLARTVQNVTVQKLFHCSAGYAILAALAMMLFGIRHAAKIRVRTENIVIDKPCQVTELRIAVVSDLHFGCGRGAAFAQQMVKKINARQPDLVILAGDIFDNDYDMLKDPKAIAKALRGLKSRCGTYAVWGNHDTAETILSGFTFDARTAEQEPRFAAFLKESEVTLLEDCAVLVSQSFYLVGRDDSEHAAKTGRSRASEAALLGGLKEDKPIFVIDHQPCGMEKLAEYGADLLVSGHTHNGQLFPMNLLMKLLWKNPYGIRAVPRADGGTLYSCVTSGVGAWGPQMRVGTNSEILMLRLAFRPGEKWKTETGGK